MQVVACSRGGILFAAFGIALGGGGQGVEDGGQPRCTRDGDGVVETAAD